MISLSFDTDWMSSEAMSGFFGRYPELPPSTFFLHDYTGSLAMEFQEANEINPHPTINFGHSDKSHIQIEETISKKPLGIRSHSCANSHMLSVEWANSGYKYQSIEVDLGNANLRTRPLAWGLYEVPIYYMDNMSIWAKKNKLGPYFTNLEYLAEAMSTENSLVFDFHPIHIALNTKSVSDYEFKKDLVLRENVDPWELGDSGKGVRSFFEQVLNQVLNSSVQHQTLLELVNKFEGSQNFETQNLFKPQMS
jgi:hypothetical protein